MKTEYISLGRLAQQTRIYDSLPSPIQKAFRHSVFLTLATNIICIPFLWYVPRLVDDIGFVWPSIFFIGPSAYMINYLLGVASKLSGYLLALNIVSFGLMVVVLVASLALMQPVSESSRGLAWLAALPSTASAISAALIVVLIVAVIVSAIFIWAILIATGLISYMYKHSRPYRFWRHRRNDLSRTDRH